MHLETATLDPSGLIPNSIFPVLLYRGACADGAAALEALFGRNGWSNAWRNGIYTFHHFHSTAHEVLGIAAGHALVRLGGDGGLDVSLSRGDVAVLPAGTGHKRIGASADLVVVGAYPDRRTWDLIRADELDRDGFAAAVARVAEVPLPRTDPVEGPDGSLVRLWTRP